MTAEQLAMNMEIPAKKAREGMTAREFSEFIRQGWRDGGYLQPSVAARALGVCPAQVSHLIKDGTLRTRTILGTKLVVGEDIMNYIEARAAKRKSDS